MANCSAYSCSDCPYNGNGGGSCAANTCTYHFDACATNNVISWSVSVGEVITESKLNLLRNAISQERVRRNLTSIPELSGMTIGYLVDNLHPIALQNYIKDLRSGNPPTNVNPGQTYNDGDIILANKITVLVNYINSLKTDCICYSYCQCNANCSCYGNCSCNYSDIRLKKDIFYINSVNDLV